MKSALAVSRRDYFLKGALPILVAASLWGVGYFIRKAWLSGVDPLLQASLTAVVVGVGAALVYRLGPREAWTAFRRHPFAYAALSLVGYLGTASMYAGIDILDLGVATFLEKFQPVFALILGALFLKEKSFTRRKVPFILLALASSVFLSSKSPWELAFSVDEMKGVGAVLLAAFLWAITTLLGKRFMRGEQRAEMVTGLRFFLVGLITMPCLAMADPEGLKGLLLDFPIMAIIVATALSTTLLGYVLFYRGLRYVSAGLSGLLEMLTPVVSLMLGLIFLGESLSVTQMLAMPMLLFSVYRVGLEEAGDNGLCGTKTLVTQTPPP